MREYMKNLGSVMMMVAFANMLVTSESIKKFMSLATGFILISTAISIIPGDLKEFKFSFPEYVLGEKEIKEAEDNYRKSVLDAHSKNLEKEIEEKFSHGSSAKVTIDSDGNISGITLRIKGDESRAISFIVNELKFPRERIKIKK